MNLKLVGISSNIPMRVLVLGLIMYESVRCILNYLCIFGSKISHQRPL